MFLACLLGGGDVAFAEDPAPADVATEEAPAPEPAPKSEAEAPTADTPAASTVAAQPTAAKQAPMPKATVENNRPAIALLLGFAFGLMLVGLRLVMRFRRDLFARTAR